jgi:16S rRNA (cytosine1402-N4)-methyltransferase
MASWKGTDKYHKPCLLDTVLSLMRPEKMKLLIDCTVGEGGHLEAVLDRMPAGSTAAGLDRDPEILEVAGERLQRFGDRVRLFVGSYAQVDEVLKEMGATRADGLIFDLGLSTYHLRMPRGFAFSFDSPLDMRYDRSGSARTAADIVNSCSEDELRDILRTLGEERRAGRIARAVVEARRGTRIETTAQLSSVVEKASGPSGRRHAATRTFQALRLHVNGELDDLAEVVDEVPELLSSGGRVVFISYHSLEDRIVKNAMRSWDSTDRCVSLVRKPVTPTEDERSANLRCRSAKLRASERR